VINDKLQGRKAKRFSFDGFLHYKFIIQFAGERIFFTIGEHSAKLQAK